LTFFLLSSFFASAFSPFSVQSCPSQPSHPSSGRPSSILPSAARISSPQRMSVPGEGERADDQRSKKSFHFEIVAIDSIRQV
jgi:hypothetical protein